MLTIEVKSNRKVITHLEVANVESDPSKTIYCIMNVVGQPSFAMLPGASWNDVVSRAMELAILTGKEKYDREMRRDHPGVHTG